MCHQYNLYRKSVQYIALNKPTSGLIIPERTERGVYYYYSSKVRMKKYEKYCIIPVLFVIAFNFYTY